MVFRLNKKTTSGQLIGRFLLFLCGIIQKISLKYKENVRFRTVFCVKSIIEPIQKVLKKRQKTRKKCQKVRKKLHFLLIRCKNLLYYV